MKLINIIIRQLHEYDILLYKSLKNIRYKKYYTMVKALEMHA